MINRDMEALLGAYVLDALDDSERAQVEAYLAENPRARAEVDELRETVAALASAPVEETVAPPELWARIAEEIEAEEIEDDVAPSGAAPQVDELAERRERKRRWVAPTLAVAASVVALVLAAQVVSLQGDLDDAREPGDEQVAAAFERATDETGARETQLVSATNDQEVARIVVLPDGRGYMVGDALDALPDDQTYQLWAVVPGGGDETKVISAGVLGADPKAASFEVDGDVDAFVLTVEEAGGVEASEQDPYAAGTLV